MSAFKLDDLLRQGASLRPRRAARWVQDHLPEIDTRGIEHGGREAIDRLLARLPKADRVTRRRGPDPAAVLWPTFLAAAGAGAAFWWWTQWARGRAEAERDRLGGEEGAAHPEDILAHAPPPHETSHPSDSAPKPSVAPEAILAHAPPPPEAPAAAGEVATVKPVVAPKAAEALARSLAVQASDGETPPKRAVRKDLQ